MKLRSKIVGGRAMSRMFRSRRARFTALALLTALVFGSSVSHAYAQGRRGSTSLMLQVRPEALLRQLNGSLFVKIRLARGASANIWVANACTSPVPQSAVITASGIYTIPDGSVIPSSTTAGSGATQVCLASSDGVLHDSLAVQVSGSAMGNSAAGTTAVASMRVPSDAAPAWAVSTEGRTTTWSKP